MIPCQDLFLEVEIPDPNLNYFVIGRDLLDNDTKLLAPKLIGGVGNNVTGLYTFVLDRSSLDSTVDLLEGIGAAKPNYKWVDLITESTEIDVQRGFDIQQGIVGTPTAGTLSAVVVDPFLEGLATQRVGIGQRCRLRAGSEVIFTGIVNAISSDYNAVDVPILTIDAIDSIGLLNAQMVDPRPRELYTTRLKQAVEQIGLQHVIEPSTTELEPTKDAMSALDLLVETQDSEGSICWIDRFGVFYSTDRYWAQDHIIPNGLTHNLPHSRFYDNPTIIFTNNPKTSGGSIGIGGGKEVCLSDYFQTADTKQVINGITFYNFTEKDDTDKDGNPIKVIERDTYTFGSGTSQRLYGDASVKLTTHLPTNTLVSYADYIFSEFDTPRVKVERIRFPLDKWKDRQVPETTALDIGDLIQVRIDDPLTGHSLQDSAQRVAKIKHNITPVEWLCEIELL